MVNEETVPATSSKKTIILMGSIIAACILCVVCGFGGVGVIGRFAIDQVAHPKSYPDISFPAREIGDSTAKVIVEEYSDFQCPYCGLFAKTAGLRLREEYTSTGKIRFIYRNFPVVDSYVSGGSESHEAALAALCAGDQNMFWEYHDYLYTNQLGENQGNYSTSRLQAFATQLKLDSLQFNQCLSDQTHLDVLNADVKRANSLGLRGTPTFFVNGVQADGSSPDFAYLFEAIDRALLTVGG